MGSLVRKLTIAMCLMAATLYVAAPFWTAWEIREAVKSDDVATLKDKIVWSSVRESLRTSIAQHAKLLPVAVNVGRQIRPTMWQRIKSMFGESMLDRFMDRYITAEGLPKLYRMKEGYRSRVRGLPDETMLPFSQRVRLLLNRVKRAEFMSLTRVEIEIEDRDRPDRHIVGTLNLVGLSWKLTGLVIKTLPADGDTSQIARAALFHRRVAPSASNKAGENEEARLVAEDLRAGRISAREARGI